MSSPPEAATTLRGLAELQAGFAAILRRVDRQVDSGVHAFAEAAVVARGNIASAARVGVYRNNVRSIFGQALERTFPVIRRRVGDAYFDRLTDEFRATHPSRSGDLHWIGAEFPRWLASHLGGTEYAWLADLARLEWACEEALIAAQRPPLPLQALASVDPDRLGELRLEMQASLRFVASDYPIWSVWRANQPEADGAPVDLANGAQHVVVSCTQEGLVLHCVPRSQWAFSESLAGGETLAAALERSLLPVDELPSALGWLFREGLVTGVAMAGGNGT